MAVNAISLDMYNDEIFCLLGHNGAGKTTTISMLTGMLNVTSGVARVNGKDVMTDMSQIRTSLGGNFYIFLHSHIFYDNASE